MGEGTSAVKIRRLVDQLDTLAVGLRAAADLPPAAAADALQQAAVSLRDVASATDDVRLSLLRAPALEVLARVLRIERRGGETEKPFEPLQRLRGYAIELRERLTADDGHDALRALQEGSHPLARLADVVGASTPIAEDAALELQTALPLSWWPNLVVAALMGRLELVHCPDAGPQLQVPVEQRDTAGPESTLSPVSGAHESEPSGAESVGKAQAALVLGEPTVPPAAMGGGPESQATRGTDRVAPPGGVVPPLAPETAPPPDVARSLSLAELPAPLLADNSPGSAAQPPQRNDGVEPADVRVASTAEAALSRSEAPPQRPPAVKTDAEGTCASSQRPEPSVRPVTRDVGVAIDATEARAVSPPPLPTASAVEAAKWHWLREGELGIAHGLALAAESVFDDGAATPSAAALEVLFLGTRLRHQSMSLVSRLADALTKLTPNDLGRGPAETSGPAALLVISGSLLPSILAPGSGVQGVLGDVQLGSLGRLYELCRLLADAAGRNLPLDWSALRSSRDKTEWEHQMDRLRREAADWVQRAPTITTPYQRATEVWRTFVRADGWARQLVDLARSERVDVILGLRRQVEEMTAAEIDRRITHADRKVLRHRHPQDIHAAALRQLHTRSAEAIALAQRRLALEEVRPGTARGHLVHHAEAVRSQLVTLAPAVHQEIIAAQQTHERDSFWSIALATVAEALRQLEAVFDPALTLSLDEPDPDRWRVVPLLRIPGMRPHDAAATPSPERVLRQLVPMCSLEPWDAAFERHCGLRDHAATRLIVTWLQDEAKAADLAATLEAKRAERLEECRDSIARRVDQVRTVLENAVGQAVIGEKQRTQFAAQLDEIMRTRSELETFAGPNDRLLTIEAEIGDARRSGFLTAQARLAKLQSHHPAGVARVRGLLEAGDLLTANEYVEALEAGATLPEERSDTDLFANFFPERARTLATFLEQPIGQADQLLSRLQGQDIPGIELAAVPAAQIDSCVAMLREWLTMKRQRSVGESRVRIVLDWLGFSTKQVTVVEQAARTWAKVITEPLKDRERCPVPLFGSLANGEYQILCDWDRSSVEDLLFAVSDGPAGTRATIVFQFSRLSEPRRRELAHLSRQKHKSILVLDEILLLYLCSILGSRLPAFFSCALPFAHAEPYTSTAGLVPVEMFYGRERERSSLMDPMGTCFIYGGRQLGKTALLRDVERTFNSPAEGRVAVYLDLKATGVGYNVEIDEFWGHLGQELSAHSVCRSGRGAKRDTVLLQVRQWLEKDERRRLLLLLDEADSFLDHDGARARFQNAAALKALMDVTGRRFKVVFAGLHNVQRTTRVANHPLAHYGEPICVGPLLNDGGARAARALVETPLRSLGYRFRSTDLVTRMLSQANYYPSLVQLYCAQLLRHVRSAPFDSRTSPPYRLEVSHIEEAYRSRQLRQAIRDRFIWTLQLDQRYEVLAYLIAHGTLTGLADVANGGFSLSWLRREALDWWPSGFQSSPAEDAFRALLDEMVGLGVLRQSGPSHYALRSPNVVTLMGNLEEIEDQLSLEREEPLEYIAAVFRAQLDGEQQSCLTAEQDATIWRGPAQVSVVCGTKAAGLCGLANALQGSQNAQGRLVRVLGVGTGRQEFSAHLAGATGGELVLVEPVTGWSAAWLDETLRVLKRQKNEHQKKGTWRIVFAADPELLWTLLRCDAQWIEATERQEVSVLRLQPWHDAFLRQWLDDRRIPSAPAVRARIAEITGGWGELVANLPDREGSVEAGLARIERQLAEAPAREELQALTGLHVGEPASVLEVLAILESATLPELATQLPKGAGARAAVAWADTLGLLRPKGGGKWTVEPLSRRVLLAGA